MCSCSGNCNCNSTTIPRGPQGPTGATGAQGIQGIQGIQGPPGENGTSGTNGINAYSTLTVGFAQPANNNSINISVQNNTWMAPGQIIYIGPGNTSTDPGGYYKVNFLIGGSITQLNVMKLGWIDPNTTFVIPTGLVDQGARVTSAGVIGPSGTGGVIRIKPDQGVITETLPLTLNFTELTNNGQMVSFDFSITNEGSGTNPIGSASITIDGTQVFFADYNGVVNNGLNAVSALGFTLPINFVTGSVKILRQTSTNIKLYMTIFGYNIDNTPGYGVCDWAQRTWNTYDYNLTISSSNNFNVVLSGADIDYGVQISTNNIFKYFLA